MDAQPAAAPAAKRVAAEFLGAFTLVAIVVGSGIMGSNLTDDLAVVLLINALATVAGLGVLIWVLGPISGAHFNPAVTLVSAIGKDMPWREAGAYIGAQLLGAVGGAILANVMFSLPAVEMSQRERVGAGVWLGEVVATAGLIFLIGALTRTGRGHLGPVLVAAWIGSAYFFTASTSFANPAVTLGRAFTDTFAGIALASVQLFIVMQLAGAAVGAGLTAYFFPRPAHTPEPLDLPEAIHDQSH